MDVGETVRLDRGVPVHEVPRYQVYVYVPEPPDAAALSVTD